jgi:hypothetical protein
MLRILSWPRDLLISTTANAWFGLARRVFLSTDRIEYCASLLQTAPELRVPARQKMSFFE